MNTKLNIRWSTALLLLSFPVLAQQADSERNEKSDKERLTDSIAIAEAELEQLELKKVVLPGEEGVSGTSGREGYLLEDFAEAAKYDSLWLKELSENASYYNEIQETVINLDTVDPAYKAVDTETLKKRLALLNEKTPFNVEYNPSLENVINSFLLRKRGLMERMLTSSQFYFPMFEQALDKYNIPLELKYLAIVESALNPRAKSRVGATGLWQFMYGTGKMYKLDVSSYVDERSDPIQSTEAACQYLSKLYDIFGDWDLALAAYNSGPGNVNKAIRRSGGQKNYWNIRRNLPRETAGYVPAFLATMYLFEYADEHKLQIKKADRPYFETDTVHVKQMITFEQISELVGVSEEDLKTLNPSYKLNIIPKIEGKTHVLRLPKWAVGKFVNNEPAIYAHVEKELAEREKPIPQLVQAEERIRYKVRSGDYLGKIAERYGVGVSQIKRWNGLRSNNIRVGQRLTIFARNPVTTTTPRSSGNSGSSGGAKTHVVQKGDSLWTISQKYPGITIDNLKKWNGLRNNNLIPGTRLKLCECSS
ncbi:LysM peptidoglycan-binding domain-containing protein [Zeaxanthinibacter sp. PT1]|uniref:LysM peptidoglycan-binding domain-containing protein n=1 Tax=Zeaxanthinibacter TaxID=561554 RepID=UPI002349DD22|nr:LysM peptidoglycan-binding domain-containing protein [Zeaxanthinibacter sp. PT1]MDC6350630.1 LysM peptidoglycan-binding domain-containing protein [Zeaxanthinibacter sp. PT1]